MFSGCKQTPKSCSCQHCRFGKHTKAGHKEMKADERKYRHRAKVAIQKGEEVLYAAPIGNYYD